MCVCVRRVGTIQSLQLLLHRGNVLAQWLESIFMLPSQSWKSTTGDSDSLGQPQDKGQNQQMSKMDMLKQKLSNVAKQNQDKLNSSLGGNENKMSAFESKMAKFNQNNMR